MKELEEQLDMALQAKQELAAEVREHKINAAQSTLKHLEEYFTCPMCVSSLTNPAIVTEVYPYAAQVLRNHVRFKSHCQFLDFDGPLGPAHMR